MEKVLEDPFNEVDGAFTCEYTPGVVGVCRARRIETDQRVIALASEWGTGQLLVVVTVIALAVVLGLVTCGVEVIIVAIVLAVTS